ncbi:MAG TPA: YajG family lipoprotein [Steroidobacter sp.]|uniref:YajG family lipoprotein n=1 Tax=Steroidobacter sp. TaxID=1978227 RepID=UPI002ED87697
MHLLRFLVIAAAVLVAQGCAFTKATLDVKPTAAQVAGPLGDLQSISFATPQLVDSRQDKARIGWKKNGFGQNTADIVTKEPVEQIVESAVAKALLDTKHSVGDGGAVQVVGTIDRFWFDLDVNMWTVKFIGDVQCTVDFVDPQTKQSIYKSKYSGNYADTKAGGLEKTWTEVMSKALDKLIESIVLDEELVAALSKRMTPKVSSTNQ